MGEPQNDQEARRAAIRAYKTAEAAERARGVRVDASGDDVRGFRKRPASEPAPAASSHGDAPQPYLPQAMSLNHKLDSPFSTAFQAAFGAAAGFALFRLIALGVLGIILYFVVVSLTR